MKFFALFSLLVIVQNTGAAWDYKTQSTWPTTYPNCDNCAQSPIDLVDAKADGHMEPMTFLNYKTAPPLMSVVLDAHTVKISFVSLTPPTIKNGGLDSEYIFAQAHFHWGSNNSVGSEHKLKGKQYPAEVHLVHYKKEYGSVVAALPKEDGLAVVGAFIDVGDTENADLKALFDTIGQFTPIGNSASSATKTITGFPVSAFLPSKTNTFYRYPGSLTTPGCDESVIWTVMETPLMVSSAQMEKLRNLKYYDYNPLPFEVPITDTFREVQPLNYRQITYRQAGIFGLGLKDLFRSFFGIGNIS